MVHLRVVEEGANQNDRLVLLCRVGYDLLNELPVLFMVSESSINLLKPYRAIEHGLMIVFVLCNLYRLLNGTQCCVKMTEPELKCSQA